MVSFCIVTYNQERFVGEAINAALRQNYPDIEFIISDDCSTDSTFETIKSSIREARSAAPIKLLRSPVNLGNGGNINRVMAVAKGDIIVIAAGDDVSHPDRTRCCVDTFTKYRGRVHSVYTDHIVVSVLNDDLRETHFAKRYNANDVEYLSGDLETFILTVRPLVTGATHAWHRDVFDKYGPLGSKTMFEDMAISFRSLSMGGICRIKDPLVLYRRHETNLSQHTCDSYRSLDELKRHKLKELNGLRGFLVGYKYMKKDLFCVTGLDELERRRLLSLLNKRILWYRIQIRLRSGASRNRMKDLARCLRVSADIRDSTRLVKLMMPENVMDRARVLKQWLKHR